MPCCRFRKSDIQRNQSTSSSEEGSPNFCSYCLKNGSARVNFPFKLNLPERNSNRGRMMNWRGRNLVCCIIGVLFIAVGLLQSLLIVSYGSDLLTTIIKKGVILGPESPSLPFWKDIPIPLTTKVYLFNVSNPTAFAQGQEVPKLKEVGPFIFDEYHNKVKVNWNKNDTVTYQQVRSFFKNKDQNDDDLNMNVTIVNAVAATLSAMVSPMSSFERVMVNVGLLALKENLFVTSTPRKIVFDGYRDPLLDAAAALAKVGIQFPGEMDKFAIFYGRNGSDWFDGVFNMYTGRDNIKKANRMVNWNYSNHVFFPDRCGEVRGNAEMFAPFLEDEVVELYSNDLCRPITMGYTGTTHVRGVDGRKYEILPSFFANKTVNPDNYCFEGHQEFPSGTFNASICRFNAPVFISQPHFYQADPYYANQFPDGTFHPSREDHGTYFIINSASGVPIEVVARFQVNLYIEKIPELKLFKKLKGPIFFPAFWFETKMSLGGSMAMELWFLSNLVQFVLGIGLLILAGGLTCTMVTCIRSKAYGQWTNQVIENPDDQEDNSVAPLVNTEEPE